MARAAVRHILSGLAMAGLLMGCVEGASKTAKEGGAATATPRSKAGNAEVEAPDVFQTTDTALWDGRPSLGGIWVASPDVQDPERVLMVNQANGKTVTGALFRRERDNPGPRLQISSDAAEALGILAGQPTELRVTALRKEEIAEPAPKAEVTAETDLPGEAAESAEAAPADAAAAETAALATAALAKTAGGGGEAGAAVVGQDGEVVEGEVAAVDPAAPPKPKTWKEKRAEAKAAREAKKKAAAEAKAAEKAAAAAAAGTVVEGAVEGTTEGAVATAETAAVTAIESVPLDARKPDVAAAPGDAPETKTEKAVKKAVVPVEPAAEPAAEPAPAATTGTRPIQVASFSKEENAKRAAEALAKIGITATPQKSERDGKAVWGVVVMGDDATLKKIKDAGFADAYYLK